VGWFRFYFDDDRWQWSPQVDRVGLKVLVVERDPVCGPCPGDIHRRGSHARLAVHRLADNWMDKPPPADLAAELMTVPQLGATFPPRETRRHRHAATAGFRVVLSQP
jgi:hypothetical protein